MYSQQYQYQQQPSTLPPYQGYQQPPQFQQYPPYPPPPNPHAMSPQEFRHWFLSRLAELVVNQKNIIHNLAYIANEHMQRMGQVVAESIEFHIRRAHPQIKLPAWYLLDSIAKNIGAPYTHYFSKFVARLFLDSYHAVDLQTRSKMEEMLVTWRTGGRGGVELFGPEVQAEIEKGVWSTPSASSSNALRRSGAPSKSQVLTELEVTLAQKMRAVELDPFDNVAMGHIDALTQLRTLVQSSTVTPDELSAIATQLRSLARTTASTAAPLPPMVPPQPAYAAPPAPGSSVSYPSVPGLPLAASASYPNPVNVSSLVTPANAPAPPAVPSAANISALFQNLVKAGVVSGASTAGSATAPSAPPANPLASLSSLSSLSTLLAAASASAVKPAAETVRPANDPQADAEREYERAILSLNIQTTASGLQQKQSSVISLLYDQLPLQCKSCGQRFPDDGPVSKKRYQDHLDLHFRQNLRNAQASSTSGVGTMGRGYTMSWFIGKQDWVNDVTRLSTSQNGNTSGAAEKGKARALSPSSAANSKLSNEERIAKLRSSYVVIPPGDEAKPTICPLCKEPLPTEFLEDEEEWVWRNAVSTQGKVYHATCHADAVAAGVARLRNEGIGATRSSRSATPDPSSVGPVKEEADVKPVKSLAPSPRTSVKRKLLDNEDSSSSDSSTSTSTSTPSITGGFVKADQTDSPRPLKKLALGPA